MSSLSCEQDASDKQAVDDVVENPDIELDATNSFLITCVADVDNMTVLPYSQQQHDEGSSNQENPYEGAMKGMVDFVSGYLEQACGGNQVDEASYDDFDRFVVTW